MRYHTDGRWQTILKKRQTKIVRTTHTRKLLLVNNFAVINEIIDSMLRYCIAIDFGWRYSVNDIEYIFSLGGWRVCSPMAIHWNHTMKWILIAMCSIEIELIDVFRIDRPLVNLCLKCGCCCHFNVVAMFSNDARGNLIHEQNCNYLFISHSLPTLGEVYI